MEQKDIEVEIRSFITEEQYSKLIAFLNANAQFLDKDYQETYYFDCDHDLRIQKNSRFSKIWLKEGNLHDDHRKEHEARFPIDQFEALEKIFLALGYDVDIKWFRDRHRFDWNGIKVCIDSTKGYGRIIELEIMTTEKDKEKALEILKNKMAELDIGITPKSEFRERYEFYRQNWKDLTEQ